MVGSRDEHAQYIDHLADSAGQLAHRQVAHPAQPQPSQQLLGGLLRAALLAIGRPGLEDGRRRIEALRLPSPPRATKSRPEQSLNPSMVWNARAMPRRLIRLGFSSEMVMPWKSTVPP